MGKYKYLVVVILFLLTGFADHVSLAQAANIQLVLLLAHTQHLDL